MSRRTPELLLGEILDSSQKILEYTSLSAYISETKFGILT